MPKILLCLLLTPFIASSQSYKVFDRHLYSYHEVTSVKDSINRADAGWDLPTAKEMDSLFRLTFDKRQLRSSITASDCYTRDFEVYDNGGKVDTMYIVGTMRGREFSSTFAVADISGKPRRYCFFLIKRK